jgi:hypothetical protein
MIVLGGCVPSGSDQGHAPSLPARAPAIQGASGLEHDFGAVLAQGQDLRHEFVLVNHGTRPVRLLEAHARTPCCSGVGPLPSVIPAGDRVSVPVVLKAGYSHGRKRVEFVVRTDDPDQAAVVLTLGASFVADLDVETLPESDGPLTVGQEGRRRLRVVCRQVDGVGRAVPDRVDAGPPLEARFIGEPNRSDSGAVHEEERIVEVSLPADRVGSHRADLMLRWSNDDPPMTLPIAWEVVPRIRAVPSGLVLHRDGGMAKRSIVLRAEQTEFRIQGMAGALLTSAGITTTPPSRVHRLDLALDPSRLEGDGATDIRIETDDPYQPVIAVSVLVLPGGGEVRP